MRYTQNMDVNAAEGAKEKHRAAGGDKRSTEYKETASIKNDKSDLTPINTQKEVAKAAGVSGKITPVDNFGVTLHTRAR